MSISLLVIMRHFFDFAAAVIAEKTVSFRMMQNGVTRPSRMAAFKVYLNAGRMDGGKYALKQKQDVKGQTNSSSPM